MLFVADLVADLDDPMVAPITSMDTNTAVHFAIYQDDQIVKLVLLNLEYYTGDSDRPSTDFDVSDLLGSNVRVSRLTGSESASTDGVSWAGQTVDGSGAIVGDVETEDITDGIVTLLASEGAIVELA